MDAIEAMISRVSPAITRRLARVDVFPF